VFKMSSMVGGALGVALLTAFGRAFGEDEAVDAARDAGLSHDDIVEAKQALVGSDTFQAALAKLPGDLQRAVTATAENAFSSGVADAMVATGIIALAATIAVALIWPRRRASATNSATTSEGGTA
jgi:hypothetical protein